MSDLRHVRKTHENLSQIGEVCETRLQPVQMVWCNWNNKTQKVASCKLAVRRKARIDSFTAKARIDSFTAISQNEANQPEAIFVPTL